MHIILNGIDEREGVYLP